MNHSGSVKAGKVTGVISALNLTTLLQYRTSFEY
jgi:hypothetical protein